MSRLVVLKYVQYLCNVHTDVFILLKNLQNFFSLFVLFITSVIRYFLSVVNKYRLQIKQELTKIKIISEGKVTSSS